MITTASPQLAALAAYWRALNPLLSPAELKILLTDPARGYVKMPDPPLPGDTRFYPNKPQIWNGKDTFCNQWPTTWSPTNPAKRFISDSIGYGHSNSTNTDEGDVLDSPSCSFKPTLPKSLTFTSAPTPSPTCLGNGCGKLCVPTTPFCGTSPGFNPDFMDPLNPQSPQNPSNPNYTPPGTAIPSTTSGTPPVSTAPPDPSGTPGPAKPKPIYTGGHPLRFKILHITTSDSPATNLLASLTSADDQLVQPDLCNDVAGTIQDNAPKDLPSSISKINIQGDTCTFTATSDWNAIKIGERVGTLDCKKWAQARCIKDNQSGHCANVELPDGLDRLLLSSYDWVL